MKDIKQIVKNYLEENNYDGLYSQDGECACEISNLPACGEDFSDCRPGIKKTWDELTDKQKEHCEIDCEFYMIRKPK